MLAAAARHLDGETLDGTALAAARGFLASLQVPAAMAPGDRADLAGLLRLGSRLEHLFSLPAPAMPGLFFFGAIARPQDFGAAWGDPRGVAGVGTTALQALRGCLGEAAEFLSQHLCDGHPAPLGPAGVPPPADAVRRDLGTLSDPADWHAATRWCAATDADGGRGQALPYDLFWRRDPAAREVVPRFSPGLGCAAGPTRQAAALAAVLELVERDALALWWRGGRRARPLPDDLAERAGLAGLERDARRDVTGPRTWYLDLTTDLAVPVILAASIGPDGQGFAFGVAADLSAEAAARSAFLELAQLELADHLVAGKLARGGQEALNEIDRMHLARSRTDMSGWSILDPDGAAQKHDIPPPTDSGAAERLAIAAARLKTGGHVPLFVDQTNSNLNIPVMRAVAATLQPDPGEVETSRLREARTCLDGTTLERRPKII